MIRRGLLAVVIAALALGCATTQTLEAPRPRLGVQSNEQPLGPITLRVQPPAGARYQTSLTINAEATVFGQQMRLDGTYDDERIVVERRPDGTTVMSARTTGGSYRLALGDLPARDEPFAPSDVPITSVIDARGRTVDDAMFGPSTAGADRAAFLRAVVDPLLDALAYPERAISPGEEWESAGERPLPDGRGSVRYAMTQTLVRVEGSGASALAVISVRGTLDGSGLGGDGPSAGTLRIDGAYTVAVADGLVRGMQSRVEGRVTIGDVPDPRSPDAGALDVPFEGTIRYRAQ